MVNKTSKGVFASAWIGTMLEYYDYSIFLFLAPLLSNFFFPYSDPVVNLISSYGISFLGTLARPVGGLLFGYIGDRFGRRIALFYSISIMSCASFLMAIMPAYEDLGFLSPILVLICRILQSLSAGGELNGAAIFSIEHAGKNHGGLAGGILSSFAVFGILFASLVSYVCLSSLNPLTNWRYCFLLGSIIGVVGFFLRRKTKESQEFILSRKQKKNLSLKAMKTPIISAFFISGAFSSFYYFCFVLPVAYLPLIGIMDKAAAMKYNSYFLGVYVIALCLGGWLADVFKPRKTLTYSAFVVFLLATPFAYSMGTSDLFLIHFLRSIITIASGIYIGGCHLILTQLFPVRHRYSYISTLYSLGSALLGSSTPLVCIKLWQLTGIVYLPGIWVMATSMLAMLGVFLSKKN